MNPTKFLYYNLALSLFFLFGCKVVEDPPMEIEGWKPIYGQTAELENIHSGPPESIQKSGKIFLFNPYIFINDLSRGIHVVDNSNPQNPVPVAFIHIPLNVDMAVKNNILYADNGSDLVAIDISNLQDVKVVKRIPHLFPVTMFPPYEGYFECVEPVKGQVVGWELALLQKPECFR